MLPGLPPQGLSLPGVPAACLARSAIGGAVTKTWGDTCTPARIDLQVSFRLACTQLHRLIAAAANQLHEQCRSPVLSVQAAGTHQRGSRRDAVPLGLVAQALLVNGQMQEVAQREVRHPPQARDRLHSHVSLAVCVEAYTPAQTLLLTSFVCTNPQRAQARLKAKA